MNIPHFTRSRFSAFRILPVPLCFSWSQKVALCCTVLLFSLCGDIAAGVQTVNCDHASSSSSSSSSSQLRTQLQYIEELSRLVTLQWSELWHVNSLQSLCWEIGDKVGHEISCYLSVNILKKNRVFYYLQILTEKTNKQYCTSGKQVSK